MKRGEKSPLFPRKEVKKCQKLIKNGCMSVTTWIQKPLHLKIGTTNDLERRRQEHTRNYHRAKDYTLPANEKFQYDWYLPLSKYNTLRFEDFNREEWKKLEFGTYVRNDRFACPKKPDGVTVTIRKVYKIPL